MCQMDKQVFIRHVGFFIPLKSKLFIYDEKNHIVFYDCLNAADDIMWREGKKQAEYSL